RRAVLAAHRPAAQDRRPPGPGPDPQEPARRARRRRRRRADARERRALAGGLGVYGTVRQACAHCVRNRTSFWHQGGMGMGMDHIKKSGLKALKYLQDIDRDDVLEYLGLQERRSALTTTLGSLGIFVLGCLVGAGIGLAFAPKPGDELR